MDILKALSFSGIILLSSGAIALAPDSDLFTPNTQETTSESLTEQRYHYELAKSALKSKDTEAFQKHYAMLGDYPLIPYLDYAQLKPKVKALNFSELDKFLETNKGTFLAYRLREQILQTLASQNKWHKFGEYYDKDIARKSLKCQSLFGRISTGDTSALDEVADIWTQGKSQPKACDPLFKKWQKAGMLNDDIAWLRFNNAMKKRKRSLARYVTRFMSTETKAYAETYLEIHAYPGRIKQHRRFSESSLKMQQIIAHGIQRFARIDPKQALQHWERYEAQQLFPADLSIETKIYLIKRLTYKGHTAEAEKIIQSSSDLKQTEVLERLIREALRNEQYAKVLEWIDHLDEKAMASDRWQYWRARMQDEIGGRNYAKTSSEIYHQLSQQRSFYGFLSADILQKDYELEDSPSAVTASTELVIANLPSMKRAKELWLKLSYGEAHAEWQFATKRMSDKELAAAGKIAQQWGWHNKGIHAMIRGNLWDDLNIRFPLAYRETVEKASTTTSIEPTLIYAIARQESAFAANARSSAGAMGLMQLMPGTARQTAKRSGITHQDSYLYNAEYNINLGSRYLNELLGKYNGNRVLAAAAYNAGPHRVKQWIKRTPLDTPFDVWIETIPFKETRGYVQNVLAFSVIYSYRMGQEGELMRDNEIFHPVDDSN